MQTAAVALVTSLIHHALADVSPLAGWHLRTALRGVLALVMAAGWLLAIVRAVAAVSAWQ